MKIKINIPFPHLLQEWLDYKPMKTITIHQPGDKVFWLGNQEFLEGTVKSVSYTDHSENKPYPGPLTYRCIAKCHHPEYQGDLVMPDKIFSSAETMIQHYAEQYGLLAFKKSQISPLQGGYPLWPTFQILSNHLSRAVYTPSMKTCEPATVETKICPGESGPPAGPFDITTGTGRVIGFTCLGPASLGALFFRKDHGYMFLNCTQKRPRFSKFEPLGVCTYEDAQEFERYIDSKDWDLNFVIGQFRGFMVNRFLKK